MKNNLEEYCLEALLKAKKKNLTQQSIRLGATEVATASRLAMR